MVEGKRRQQAADEDGKGKAAGADGEEQGDQRAGGSEEDENFQGYTPSFSGIGIV